MNIRNVRVRASFIFIISLFLVFGFALSAEAQAVNLIQNGSLETASGSAPANWIADYWGSPVPTFTYAAVGNGGTKGATVTLASNSTGDAHWNPSAPVTVTPGATYTYSTWYNSTVASEIDAEYTSTSGAVTYAWLADVPSSGGVWKQLSVTFAVPSGITKALPYHLIFTKGSLTIDDISLVSGSGGPTSTTTPPVTPTLTLSANPTLITSGQSSTITWSSTNTASCAATGLPGQGGWTASTAVSGTQSVSPTATTTYSMTCAGAGSSGNVSQQVTVSVVPPTQTPPATPTLTFTASPTSITSGQSSTLSWNSTNVTSCTASGGWTGSKALSGSQSVSPTATTTYTLSCTGAGGNVSQQTTVNVAPVVTATPSLNFTATPASITRGQTSTLTWSAANITSCTASGSWTGTKALSGSQNVTPTANATYTLSCTGAGGNIAKTASVTVSAPPTPGQFTEGMVTLSFDDAWASQYTTALPILNASGLPATFYLISEVIQNNSNFPGYMTPSMATTIANAGYEIADHTATHADLTTISQTQINNEIINSRTYLQNLTGKSITSIAYPYGSVNTTVKNLTKAAGYTNGRGVDDSQLNTATSDKYDLFGQCVEKSESLATIKSWIDKAKANKQWYILCFHEIGSSSDQYAIPASELQAIVNYIKQTGIKTVTVAQGRALMAN